VGEVGLIEFDAAVGVGVHEGQDDQMCAWVDVVFLGLSAKVVAEAAVVEGEHSAAGEGEGGFVEFESRGEEEEGAQKYGNHFHDNSIISIHWSHYLRTVLLVSLNVGGK
jgi:hypothetical protein